MFLEHETPLPERHAEGSSCCFFHASTSGLWWNRGKTQRNRLRPASCTNSRAYAPRLPDLSATEASHAPAQAAAGYDQGRTSRLKLRLTSNLPAGSAKAKDAPMETPDTRYAKTEDGTYIAYQVAGEGPDLAWQLDYQNNVEDEWEDPLGAAWYPALARFSRLILHDRRGVGLSSRHVPPPNLETRVADLEVVLDAAGADRVALGGSSNPAPTTSCSRLLIRSACDRSSELCPVGVWCRMRW